MKKFRFREFQVYRDSRKFSSKNLKSLTRIKFPKEEQFCLTSQLWRALDSIILNIAEGSDRGTDKDFAHFLNTSHTSLNEVVACLDVALDSKYLTEKEHDECLKESELLGNQLTAFRKRLLDNPTK
ncbi:four helix bundle protein [Candidatus Peregrinibacteria bacterium]|nr:four helix bundle protein [Candidatus Peregrinibacteria bacterium]